MSVVTKVIAYSLGGHTGEDAEQLLDFGLEVVIVEAHPDLCRDLETRFRASERVTVICGAVGVSSSPAQLFSHVNDQWHTTSKKWSTRNQRRGDFPTRKIEVRRVRLRDLYCTYGLPSLIVCDIEGNDLRLLRELYEDRLPLPSAITTELDCSSLQSSIAQLRLVRRLGYSRTRVVQQNDKGSIRDRLPGLRVVGTKIQIGLTPHRPLEAAALITRAFVSQLLRGDIMRRFGRVGSFVANWARRRWGGLGWYDLVAWDPR